MTITEVRPDSDEAVILTGELDAQLFQYPYPPESRHALTVEQLVREAVVFFVARCQGELAACGGVKLFGAEYGEVKRMFVRPQYRGLGLGKAILERLAEHARERGVPLLRLETGIYQLEAIGLYERAGFQRRPAFGKYTDDRNTVFFEKALDAR